MVERYMHIKSEYDSLNRIHLRPNGVLVGQWCDTVVPPESVRSQGNPPRNYISIPQGFRLMSTDTYGISGMAGGYAMGFSRFVKAAVQHSFCCKANFRWGSANHSPVSIAQQTA